MCRKGGSECYEKEVEMGAKRSAYLVMELVYGGFTN